MAKFIIEDDVADQPQPTPGKFVIEDEAPQKAGIADRLMSAYQGPTMGFGDEIAGVGGAIAGAIANLTPLGDGKSFAENYRQIRDQVRGRTDNYVKENPVSGHAERLVASLPALAAVPFKAGATTAIQRGIEAAKAGAGFGAVSGLGESHAEYVPGMAADSAKSAAIGGVLGPVLAPVINTVAPIVGKMGAKAAELFGRSNPDTAGRTAAELKIAEAMQRDQAGIENPIAKATSRMASLGDEAVVADAAGQNTRQLLDTVASLPGAAKNKTARLIRDRQATRSQRIFDAAEEGLSPTGARMSGTLEALETARKEAAGPLYEQVNNTTLTLTPEIESILERASGAFGRAKEIAKVGGTKFELGPKTAAAEEYGSGPFSALLTRVKKSEAGPRTAPLEQMDTLKRALYDAEQGHINPETGQLNEVGRQYKLLRRELVDALDNATVDPKTGTSFYKAARDAYAGPTELRNAVRLGNDSIKNPAWKIREATDGMSSSEMEAFRIGAFEALRQKAGTEGGTTSLLKMWKEPATSEKLKELFKDESAFRLFSAKIAAEERLKLLDSAGRGKLGNHEDMTNNARDAAHVAKGFLGGSVPNAIASVANIVNRVRTPENVRNHIADILTSRGADAEKNINSLLTVGNRVAQEKSRRASRTGAVTGAM